MGRNVTVLLSLNVRLAVTSADNTTEREGVGGGVIVGVAVGVGGGVTVTLDVRVLGADIEKEVEDESEY